MNSIFDYLQVTAVVLLTPCFAFFRRFFISIQKVTLFALIENFAIFLYFSNHVYNYILNVSEIQTFHGGFMNFRTENLQRVDPDSGQAR